MKLSKMHVECLLMARRTQYFLLVQGKKICLLNVTLNRFLAVALLKLGVTYY